ncbi:MAG: tetratricopeptide repeat protein [Armatimonadia bacterium]|nr:tetratricopeptide repeat protein [Armatimonadia bacterium]
MEMRIQTRTIALTALVIVTATCGAFAAELAEPPSSHDAALLVAGEPQHGRVQPIDVIAGHTWALPALTEGLTSDSADTRARCAFLLGQIASRDASEALEAALEDPSRDVRMFAGMALARMGDFDGYHAARASYDGTRWWIRYWAVDALARLNRIPEVALDDPDPLVRTVARAGSDGSWGPVRPQQQYAGPDDATLDEVMLGFTNYMVGETDWWWHAGHYEQIIRGQETIYWLDPTWLDGLTNAAYLYWSLERDGEALATYRRAVAMHPDRWEAHFELGFFYFNAQERYDDAIPEFAEARELGCPPEKTRMLAHALEHAGHPEKAQEVWQELLANNPRDGVAIQNLKRIESILGAG